MKILTFIIFLVTLVSCGADNTARTGSSVASNKISTESTGYYVKDAVLHQYCSIEPHDEEDYVCGRTPCSPFYSTAFCQGEQSEAYVLFENKCSLQMYSLFEVDMSNCKS